MTKPLNRNLLKLIGLVTMLIDHIGYYFLNNNIYFRIIGRLSFPIFAAFIAQGYFYTKNRKKYFLLMLLFALISQIPYYLVFQNFELNILFTFLFAIIFIFILEKYRDKNQDKFVLSLILIAFNLLLIVMFFLNMISFGYFGILIVVAFYFLKNSKFKYSVFIILNLFITLPAILQSPTNFYSYIQLFASFAAIPLILYNGKLGKVNLKYLFYIFYPAHLLFIYLLGLIL